MLAINYEGRKIKVTVSQKYKQLLLEESLSHGLSSPCAHLYCMYRAQMNHLSNCQSSSLDCNNGDFVLFIFVS